MMRKKSRALALLLILPALLVLTSCFDYTFDTSPTREKLIGTWVADDLPGRPSMTFTDETTYFVEFGEQYEDGKVEFTGWPADIFDREAAVQISDEEWSHPRDWTGSWDLKAAWLVLTLEETDKDPHATDPLRIGAKLDVYDSLFSLNCIDVYFTQDYGVGATRMCKV